MKRTKVIYTTIALLVVGCAPPATVITHPEVPSLRYANNLRQQMAMENQIARQIPAPGFKSAVAIPVANDSARAQLHFVSEDSTLDPNNQPTAAAPQPEIVSNEFGADPGYDVYRSSAPNIRDYNGPLSLGDPGVTASLWQEGRGVTDLFRDYRAFQPMDLLTIVVSETSEGKKEADTDSKTESTNVTGISALFGFENDAVKANSDPSSGYVFDPGKLIDAESNNEFKGEGQTVRKGSLKARISAMVVETLPGGTMRVEGEKIIAVNNEEQVMIISGLVRPQDVSSTNEVDSTKIANLRIDYFGRGTVGDAQTGGWLGGLLRRFWPF